jgi:hypothetical protein
MVDLSALNQTRFSSLEEFITTIVNSYLIIGVAILAVIFLIKSGISYILSGGDSKKTEEAQKSIVYIIIGLVICILAPLLIQYLVKIIISS